MIPKRVCEQQKKLLQDKRLITGLMKPENTSHLPTHHAVVAEFDLRHNWQPLRLSLPMLLKRLWVFGISMYVSPFLLGRRDEEGNYVHSVVLSLSLLSHIYRYQSSTCTHIDDPHHWGRFSRMKMESIAKRPRDADKSATSDPGDYKM